ncbi:rRNA maturation RNase YbeY [uncultured Draconibacterium sp.]|uniref:rRNA maturation RNase YbeY n=1 Tax=uncultured Draconibacterium sp. TaxID=1573823 RepID=UPI0025D436FB|nr:rRNA maturation RNase YbeY [uncultured Draconibacterium sp.]
MKSITFYFEDIKPLDLKEKSILKGLKLIIEDKNCEAGEISVIFCSDDYLLEMNKTYLNHDYYTDIITFDYVDKNVISGDLFISTDRVKENAEGIGSTFTKELYRVVFHGVLHLVGYKDKTDEEQKEMTKMEDYYLSKIDFNGVEV